MIKIRINTDNAAFEGGASAAGAEVARILRKLASDMERFSLDYARWALLDGNGNTVGECVILDDDDPSREGRDTTSEDGEDE
jgi:acyl-CoA reductase-like NAD-dependent aldehyde dehydrogenase